MLPRRRPARRGVAAVELAVLLPLIIFILLLAVDFCRIFYFSQCVNNAARVGAIWASDPVEQTKSPYATLQAAVNAEAAMLSPAPTATSSSGTDANGDPYVTVTVAWTFNTVAGFPGIPNSLDLSKTV